MKKLKNLILVALVFFVGLGFCACKDTGNSGNNSGGNNAGNTKQTYTITYLETKGMANSNPTTYTEDAETIILKDLENTDDYEFLGWYNGETKVTEITKGSKGNLTLTAKWKETYKITYQDTKGLTNENPTTYTEDAETIILKDLKNTDDYEFLGWYNGEAKVTEITKGSKGNLTLTAKWNKKLLIIYENSVVGVTSAGKVATKIEIPNGVTSILDNAFSYCTVLREVIIPDSVINIGKGAFIGCSSLQEITLPFVGGSETENTFLGYIFAVGEYYKYSEYSKYVPESLKKVTITKATSIGSYAFSNCGNLTSIIIPDSVTSIGQSAFSGCSSLTSVITPDSVTSIGIWAFAGCDSLTSITIGNSVTRIENSAFNGDRFTSVYYTGTIENWCNIIFDHYNSNPMYYASHFYIKNSNGEYEELTDIEIPSTITKIKYYTFYGFNNVAKVTIGNNVISIGEDAFYNCSSLISVTIPNRVTSIGGGAFYDCYKLIEVYNLSSLNIEKGSSNYGRIGYYAKDIYTTLDEPSKLKTSNGVIYYINGTEKIAVASENINATSIVIDNDCTEINQYAFKGCTRLQEITLPFVGESETKNTFLGYIFGANYHYKNSDYVPKSLKKVTITRTTSIGGYAFSGCSSLTSITIPNSVTSIGGYAFSGCSSLTSITIPDSVTSIGEDAFYNCNSLQEMTLPFIGGGYLGYLFGASEYSENYKCVPKSLKKVTITKSIGSYAFYNCRGLTSITIGNSVTSIRESAFYNCNSLTSITIGNSVTSIGWEAFRGCSSLTSITIPNSVKSIGSSAFSYCSSLTSVTIGNGVTSIGEDAFSGCSSLQEITLPFVGESETENTFLGYIFGASKYSENSKYVPSSLKMVTITKSIGNYAFYYCNSLTSVTIGNNVTNIGDYAFKYCRSLTNVTIGNSVTSIGSFAFSGCESLTSVYYTGTIENWCNITFSDIDSPMYYASQFYIKNSNGEYEELIEIEIPNTVTKINDYAFRGFGNVTKVTIPNSVKSIGGSAFSGCSSLTSVTIGNSVKSIGGWAFSDCSNLTKVYYNGTSSDWDKISIYNFGNSNLTNSTRYYYTETKPTDTGNYWHYDTDGTTILEW